MLKQLLTGGSIFALLLASSFSAQAKPTELMLQSQLQTPGSTQITPAPRTTTTPRPDALTPRSRTRATDTALCRSFPVGSPTGGGTRQRLLARQRCDFTYPRFF